jgi:medium-chain acyl-[acyl-carrier-protein] hydrolase
MEMTTLVLLASTAWFVIDTERRERIIPDWWQTADYPFGPKVFCSKLVRLNGSSWREGEQLRVNYGDLDQNGHVNNTRYIEWILNSLSLEFHQSHVLRSLEVNYLAEAVYEHDVFVWSDPADSGMFHHGIRAEDTELFRASSVWKPMER